MPVLSSPILYWPLMLFGAYLLGSIPFAQVIARMKGVDLREVGSGNIGAGNLTRSVGWGWGLTAGLLDSFKGLVPVWLALRSGLGPGAAGLVGIAAVVGHNWSIIMKGRSGRGLATAAGLVVALHPPLIIWVGGWSLAGWKIGSGLAGFLGWGLLPIVSTALGAPFTESIVIMLLSVILVGRRMQGNPGDETDTASMMRRAIYDRDLIGERPGETAEDPLTP
jgi:glycerol-3-phosphate acyltransferase PlsY